MYAAILYLGIFQSGCGASLILVLHLRVPLCCYPEMRRVCGLKGCFTAGLRALQVPLPNSQSVTLSDPNFRLL